MAPPPTAFASDYAYQGAEKFTKGDLEGAAQDYDRAFKQQPNNINYIYEYGKVLLELSRYDQALTLADRAIEIAPGDVRGYALKAHTLAWTDSATSVTVSIQGEQINPNFSPLYSARAIAYTQLGRYQLAEENGWKAINLDPYDLDARRAMAWPLIYLGRNGEAIEQLEQAISINPNLSSPYFQLAFEYKSLRLNQPEMAIAIYEHILANLQLSPADEAKANLRICETYSTAIRARYDWAEPYCQRAIEINPNYGSAYRELGRMQYQRRNYEGSIESFETCERLKNPDERGDIECWSLRGLAHYWLADCDKAWTVLNQALERATRFGDDPATFDTINTGIYNVTQNCPAYNNIALPTPIPPTLIPPTPIGGL
jgi:tetratricopeptide (TPR) repeat protein